MKRTVLIIKPMQPFEMERLDNSYDVVRLWEEVDPEASIKENYMDIQAIISSSDSAGVSDRLISALPNLEVIAQYGISIDNIDLCAAAERGIAVCNTPDLHANDTADVAMGLIVSLARRIVEADMFVRVGRWNSGAMSLSSSLSEKKVGIIGMGPVGRSIAVRASAFNMPVIYYDNSIISDAPYNYYDSIEALAFDSDFLILSMDKINKDKKIITNNILHALGRKGYFVNVSMGDIVDEEALLVALRNKTIAGAALDVFENGTNVPEELYKMDNVVLTPNLCAATLETRSKMGQLVLNNLDAYFNGHGLLTPVEAVSIGSVVNF